MDELRRWFDQVLTVVQDQQQISRLQMRAKRFDERPAGLFAHAEYLGRLAGHDGGVAYGRQVDEPRAIAIGVEHIARDLQREPGLAQAADAKQCQQSRALQQRLGFLDFALASDKRRQMSGKIVRRRLERAQRRKLLPQAWVHDLVRVLAARDAPEAHVTEVAKGASRRQSARNEVRDRLRGEHLASIRESHDARGAIDAWCRRTRCRARGPSRHASRSERGATSPPLPPGRQRTVGSRWRPSSAIGCVSKGGVNPVAGRLDHTPAMCFNGSTQQHVVPSEGVRHPLGLLFPLLGAALDVGEQ